MMKQYLMVRQDDSFIVGTCLQPDPEAGPVIPQPSFMEGVELIAYDGEFTREGHSDTEVAHWVDNLVVWTETRPLAESLAEALALCYTDIDAVVFDAVGNRAEEYKDAEAEARTFIDSGCVEPAPRSVATFAQKNPTMQVQTNEWAALQVIGRADALANAKKAMRDQRFESQYDMRAATTPAELRAAVQAWQDFIDATRAALGLPPASR